MQSLHCARQVVGKVSAFEVAAVVIPMAVALFSACRCVTVLFEAA